MIPLNNFWSYVPIIFTKAFWDDSDELENLKKQRLKNFQKIFDTLINAFYKAKLIKIVQFSEINTFLLI